MTREKQCLPVCHFKYGIQAPNCLNVPLGHRHCLLPLYRPLLFHPFPSFLTVLHPRYHLLSHTFQPLVLGVRSPERRQIQERWIGLDRFWGRRSIAQ